jgi:hypothetical protein
LIYALGRPLHAQDMSTVRQIVRAAGRNDQRFSSLVQGVVESPLFRLRTRKSQTGTVGE